MWGEGEMLSVGGDVKWGEEGEMLSVGGDVKWGGGGDVKCGGRRGRC